jgi:tetratricopeptide (TPR) repeat protein
MILWTHKNVECALLFFCLGLLCLIGLTTLNAWFRVFGTTDSRSTVSAAKAAAPESASQPTSQPPSKPTTPDVRDEIASRVNDAKKELEVTIDADRKNAGDRIDEKMDGAKQLLDRLITLTGVYSVILGFTAFLSVKFARDEAREQVEILDKKIAEIEQSFPEFSRLDERIQRLMRGMELRMSDEADWNDDESYRALSEEQRQEYLNNEATLTSISAFALDRPPSVRARLVSIYGAFARFYLGRHNTSPDLSEADYVRALSYASRAIDLSPERMSGYRLRGAIYLSRYERLSKIAPPVDGAKLKHLLQSAESDFAEAIGKGTKDEVDAGAYYNQALTRYYEGDIAGAAAASRQLLGLKSRISSAHREKYLPDIYLNLGCFLAMQARSAAEQQRTEDEQHFSAEAVQALKGGIDDFQSTASLDGGLVLLKKGIQKELLEGGDLSHLAPAQKEEVATLIKSRAA